MGLKQGTMSFAKYAEESRKPMALFASTDEALLARPWADGLANSMAAMTVLGRVELMVETGEVQFEKAMQYSQRCLQVRDGTVMGPPKEGHNGQVCGCS